MIQNPILSIKNLRFQIFKRNIQQNIYINFNKQLEISRIKVIKNKK